MSTNGKSTDLVRTSSNDFIEADAVAKSLRRSRDDQPTIIEKLAMTPARRKALGRADQLEYEHKIQIIEQSLEAQLGANKQYLSTKLKINETKLRKVEAETAIECRLHLEAIALNERNELHKFANQEVIDATIMHGEAQRGLDIVKKDSEGLSGESEASQNRILEMARRKLEKLSVRRLEP